MSEGAQSEGAVAEEHLRPEQLFPLLWSLKQDPPPAEGEGADPQLARALRHLGEAYERSLPLAQRLGPETVARLYAHARACSDCHMRLVEDGPDAKPERTEGEIEADARRSLDERKALVFAFWRNLGIGVVAFSAAYVCNYRYQVKKHEGVQADPGLTAQKDLKVDPLMIGFMMGILVAAWFLAEAWATSRELGWHDFTAWKRAVPIVGKRWAGDVGSGSDEK